MIPVRNTPNLQRFSRLDWLFSQALSTLGNQSLWLQIKYSLQVSLNVNRKLLNKVTSFQVYFLQFKNVQKRVAKKKKQLEKSSKKYGYELFLPVGHKYKFPFLYEQYWNITKYANVSKHEKHINQLFTQEKRKKTNPIQN